MGRVWPYPGLSAGRDEPAAGVVRGGGASDLLEVGGTACPADVVAAGGGDEDAHTEANPVFLRADTARTRAWERRNSRW
jgi:hypothetical protein